MMIFERYTSQTEQTERLRLYASKMTEMVKNKKTNAPSKEQAEEKEQDTKAE